MATIINNPDSSGNNGNGGGGTGMIVGAIVLVLLLIIFFIYGLPALRNGNNNGAEVNVPDQIDVNVDTPNGDTAQ